MKLYLLKQTDGELVFVYNGHDKRFLIGILKQFEVWNSVLQVNVFGATISFFLLSKSYIINPLKKLTYN